MTVSLPTDAEPLLAAGVARRRGWRRIGFPLLAVLLGLAPFVLLEMILVVCDLGHPRRYVDPFVGFSRLHPLFERDEQDRVYRTSRARRLAFGLQEFSAEKSDRDYRIFCLGGSTVRGHPYETDTAFPRWLEIELNQLDSIRRYEVVNCGGVSYASYRLMPVLEEVLDYQPDLIVVACGHNEFLEDRTYQDLKSRSGVRKWIEDRAHSLRTITLARQLWHDDGRDEAASEQRPADANGGRTILSEEVDTRLDSRSGYASYRRDDVWRAQVLAHYEQTLRAMAAACRRANVPLLLVNLGENLRDCPPFKSEHRPGLTPEEQQVWQSAFDRAAQAEKTSDGLEQALVLYRQAEAIDAEHALTAYRIARCLDRLERFDEAAEYYVKAKDLDVCPLRMLEATHEILNSVAQETGTPLLDARTLLERSSAEGIAGNDWYVDHVHPTVGGHQRIAQALAEELRLREWVRLNWQWTDADGRAAHREHWRQLEPAYAGNGYRRVGWLEGWARRHRLFEETLPQDARGFLRYGRRLLEFDLEQEAWGAYEVALLQDSASAVNLLDQALELFQQGRVSAAAGLLRRLAKSPAAADVKSDCVTALLAVTLETGERPHVAKSHAAYKADPQRFESTHPGWQAVLHEALAITEKRLQDDEF